MANLPQRIRAAARLITGKVEAVERVKMEPIVRPTGTTTVARKTVTVDSAMQLSTVWACIRLISETVATLPLVLYETSDEGERTVASHEPLHAMLLRAPNFDNTAVEFWEGVAMSLCLFGNAYARKEMMGGRLVSLTPLAADKMTVSRNTQGALVYRYSGKEAKGEYREEQIFHVRGFGGAGDTGLSPIAFARQTIGTAIATDEFASALFSTGARPSGILTSDQLLNEKQREQLRDNIVLPFVGSDKAGGLMVLEAGLKYQTVTMTPEDSQFLQTRAFQVEEICRWFRVPPFMVGHTEKSTSWGSGLEQQLIAFLTFALGPYLRRIEQAVIRSLVPAERRAFLKPEFKVEGLLRTDSSARSAFYAVMVQNGIMTRNEVRRLENLPPLPGGDELTVQSQNVPLGHNGGPPLDDQE